MFVSRTSLLQRRIFYNSKRLYSKKLDSHDTLFSNTDAFLFDCDGVIWRGNSAIPGIPETLEFLRSLGKSIFFITNNSTKSRKTYYDKFIKLGIKVSPHEIYTSSYAVSAYFRKNPLPPNKKVYVIGENGICDELDLAGIKHLGGPQDRDIKLDLKHLEDVNYDRDVGAVVVGFDSGINYYKIQYAQLCINHNENCLFIATNEDSVANLSDSQVWAANGCMVGAIKGCTGRQPLVVGKPASYLIEDILENHKLDPSRLCMVGDRLDTDILFGKNHGLKTILTLSGVTSLDQLKQTKPELLPDYYVDSIAQLKNI